MRIAQKTRIELSGIVFARSPCSVVKYAPLQEILERIMRVLPCLLLLVLLSGCVTNQTRVTMLQAPEVEVAGKYKSIAVGRFSGQFGDVVSNDVESALMNARVQEKPVYRSVSRVQDVRGNQRSLAATARNQGAEALIYGEVTQAGVRDQRSVKQEFVCDRYKDSKKFFKKCESGRNVNVNCIERVAVIQAQFRMLDAASGDHVWNEALSGQAQSSACGNQSPLEAAALMAQAKNAMVDAFRKKIVPHDRGMTIALMDADAHLADKTRFQGALNFAREGRMDRACELFREIYDGQKNSVALNYNLGVCEESAGAFWRANEHYRLADRMLDSPNRQISEALARNDRNIKKAGSLADKRSDLISSRQLESGAAPQTLSQKTTTPSVQQVAPTLPENVSKDALLMEKRIALVIGNSRYRKGALTNPVNDARAVAAELRKSGFQVIAVEDADYARMNQAINEFGRVIKQGGVALVFYAGHGIQVKGENYLIPVDADMKSESEATYKTVNLGFVLSKLEDAKPRVNIVILDACRDNPFARSWRSGKTGLASVDAPAGTLIAYATAPGKTAADGVGSNGLFTSHFLAQMKVPNQKLEDVLKNTRKGVAQASGNEQIPWDSSSLTGDFYFRVSR